MSVTAVDGAIYAAIADAARNGLPCPDNATLTKASGIAGGHVYQALSRLEDAGLIVVTRSKNTRQVLLVDLGLVTAPTAHGGREQRAKLGWAPVKRIKPTGEAASMASSCDSLRNATIAMFERKATRDRSTVEEAMATSLYAPAAVAVWRAAA